MGVASGCPFCRGRMVSVPTPGSKIQILASYRSGWIGTVTPKDTWLDGEEFCVRFDDDPPRVTQRVLLRHDLFVSEPFVDPPQWLPSLSIDDLAVVDEFVVRFCGALFQKGKWRWQDEELYAPIVRFWLSRLPVRGEEIWEVCRAHGMPGRFRKTLVQAFDFGFGLLVSSHGRPPIKRRRVQAMSIGRYEPLSRK